MASPALFEPSFSSARLSQEIFSILESNFLFGGGASPSSLPAITGATKFTGRVRVLSIDGGGCDGGLLAGAALVRLESRLRDISGDPTARVADFFDLAAGSGHGAFLAAALFALRLPASEAVAILSKNRRLFAGGYRRRSIFRRPEKIFRKLFGDLTIRDAVKPLLIACYDVNSAAPFVFSRADAVEADAYDFPLWQMCAAACGVGPKEVGSVDGRTNVSPAAVTGAAAAVTNPTAVAITHVLHNTHEFPFAASARDLLVVSLGGGNAASGDQVSAAGLLRIAGVCQADMVDQAVAMAFGESRATNYIRIQGNGIGAGNPPEVALTERSVESVLFCGKKLMQQTNGERLDSVGTELVKEHERRERSKIPTVLIKPSVTPRTSSSSASTLITLCTSSSSSDSP